MPRDVITFAHRGGLDHAPENTLAAFLNAKAMGTGAVETDAWITRDGVVVLDHDGVVWQDGRAVPIRDLDRADLPGHIPTLAEYYAAAGTEMELSIDVQDEAAGPAIIAAARAAGGNAERRLWLCHEHVHVLEGWRRLSASAHLVHSTDLRAVLMLPAAHARLLAQRGIDALNLHQSQCTPLVAAACHAAGIRFFGWDAHDRERAARLVAAGCDGIYGNNIPAMQAAVTRSERELG